MTKQKGCTIDLAISTADHKNIRMEHTRTTVEQYLQTLPEDRRAALDAVRQVILKNLDKDYEEGIQYGMIGYFVPHRVHPAGYRCDPRQPLPFIALGSKKNYMSLHLMCVYHAGDDESPNKKHADWFQKAWAKTGKKLDMGKACIRFKKVDDLALQVIGEAIRKVPAAKWIKIMSPDKAGSKK
jgi:hypothetical protein